MAHDTETEVYTSKQRGGNVNVILVYLLQLTSYVGAVLDALNFHGNGSFTASATIKLIIIVIRVTVRLQCTQF